MRGTAGVVAFGVPANATYNTAVTATHVLACDPFGEANTPDIYDSRSAAQGTEEGIGIVSTLSRKNITLSGTLCDKSFPLLNALALGADATSTVDTTCTQHVVTPLAVDAELGSFSVYLKHTGISDTSTTGSIRYDGCLVNSLTISGAIGDVWKWSMDIATSGVGTAITTDLSGEIFPTVPMLPFHKSQWVRSTTNPSAVTADPGNSLGTIANFGGGTGNGWTNTDLSTALKSASVTISNNIETVYTAGTTTALAVGATRIGRTVSATGVFALDPASSTYLRGRVSALSTIAQTNLEGVIIRCISNVAASTNYNYGFEYLFPNMTLTSANMAKTAGTREITLGFVASKPGSLHSTYAVGWNLDTTDYA